MKLFSSTKKIEIKTQAIEKKEEKVKVTNLETFDGLGIHPFMLKTLNNFKIITPTKIQQLCIPPLLEYKNVIGGAETGSGKTAAFALPIIHHLSEDPYTGFALVLTPTRELAIQICDQFRVFGESINIKVVQVVGGVDDNMVLKLLELRPHVLVSTPGKLVSLLGNFPFGFADAKYFILDEADRLLDEASGMLNDIITIKNKMPKNVTFGLFSATTDTILKKIEPLQIDPPPIILRAGIQQKLPEKCQQLYMFVPAYAKHTYLAYVANNKKCIIFCSSVPRTETIFRMLKSLEFKVAVLHSVLPQHVRESNLAQFRSGEADVLVATDLASRGLDIPDVPLVINYDMPWTAEDYIHRSGRTARAGKQGRCISIVDQYDVDRVHLIESQLTITLKKYEVNEADVMKLLTKTSNAKEIAFISLKDSEIMKKVNFERKMGRNTKGSQQAAHKEVKKRFN
ncbi:ATP-dependent RNA helicase DBP8, putative [Entamoeba invadens IP1]|uniref:ATP-dependent RNA helicase DBP8, putative n=1 Tax=Entamoeba invadens IP1 TaxID=370355 RepID=A0A0A1UHA2_ENTIV|nr:ATP-dependent RNA helicase DBP8, putative [Entamoeba invadens IP1]ELP94967.1 ATP-dependent RNA helicase DBP8, putative [Entamoeba invadens IP1]|eukprot:XP_004261738.1 ATP-dependent RNA helicase DBP8, putative [Entamoeba invadens IP1]